MSYLHTTLCDTWRSLAHQASCMTDKLGSGELPNQDFEQIRGMLQHTPLSTNEFQAVCRRLTNIQTYLSRRERGAATYELRLLSRIFKRHWYDEEAHVMSIFRASRTAPHTASHTAAPAAWRRPMSAASTN